MAIAVTSPPKGPVICHTRSKDSEAIRALIESIALGFIDGDETGALSSEDRTGSPSDET
jgi:hypothetical protein